MIKRTKRDWIQRIAVSIGFTAICVGEIWLLAWVLNPAINSNTVWFVAFIYGLIINTMRNFSDES